ncbi:phosphatase PAP2 family protein [Micromonospora chersina]
MEHTQPSQACASLKSRTDYRLRIARVVTEASTPSLLTALVLPAIGAHGSPDTATGIWFGLLAGLFVALIPFAFVWSRVRSGRLTDHHVGRRDQRIVPLLVGLCSVLVGLGLLAVLGAPRELTALVVAGSVGLTVTAIVSLRWKMSVHTGVAAGCVAVLALVFGPVVLALCPLLVLVGWSRIQLGDHTPNQVVAGAIVGSSVAAVVFSLLQ